MIGLIMIEEDTKEDMTVLTTELMTELMIEIEQTDDLLRLPDMNLIHDHVRPINWISFLDCLIFSSLENPSVYHLIAF